MTIQEELKARIEIAVTLPLIKYIQGIFKSDQQRKEYQQSQVRRLLDFINTHFKEK